MIQNRLTLSALTACLALAATARAEPQQGYYRHPTISKDTIVFAAEAYTMAGAGDGVFGGLPVRRTYEAESSLVEGWTPQGDLLYSTSHYSTLPNTQLLTLQLETGQRQRVPLDEAVAFALPSALSPRPFRARFRGGDAP